MRRRLVALFLVGLALRLPGVAVNGMADLYQMLLDWGLGVWHRGLVASFGINYGVLSYAVLGPLAGLGEMVPRFWWAPYKVAVVVLDAAVLVALLDLVPRPRRVLALGLYWLNPWFVLHGAYQGFWEAPHLLCGLLALRALQGGAPHWARAGAWLAASSLFKPQGLVHFAGPLTLYLALQDGAGARRALGQFLAGLVGVLGGTAIALRAAGASWLALYDNFRSAFATMSAISNGGPGIWRFVSFVYMRALDLPGPVHGLRWPRPLLAALTLLAGGACLGILVVFARRVQLRARFAPEAAPEGAGHRALRVPAWFAALGQRCSRCATTGAGLAPPRPRVPPSVLVPPDRAALLVLALGALVVSQFGPRAHINHSYGALVLLVPFAVERPSTRRLWAALCGLLGLAHLSTCRLGETMLLPPERIWRRYPAAQPLGEAVLALPAFRTPDSVLAWQQRLNDGLARILPGQDTISILSLAVFVLACLLVRDLVVNAASAPRSDPP